MATFKQPNSLEQQFNQAITLSNAGQHEEAINSYRKVIAINPNLPVVHYNLGTSLQALGKFDEAAASFRKTVAMQAHFFEAYGNLGFVLQQQGKLDEAIASYQKGLKINPNDALGHFNLATALRNQGALEDAIKHFRQAITLFPNYVDAHSYLGDALFDFGDANAAYQSYQRALAINPNHVMANYGLGIFLYDADELKAAIPHFERSQHYDWLERTLYCLYKTEQYDAFKNKLQSALDANPKSPFLATLSTHYATNFGTEDTYNFCKTPIDYVYHNSIAPLAEDNSKLLAELLYDIDHADIAGRMQGRLHYGTQSSGNLFKRPEASFKALAELIKQEVMSMRQRNAASDCVFAQSFPQDIEFSSSWYVKMSAGGHLTSHIHEDGWVSGAVYLSIPQQKKSPEEGSIELSTDGDNYPRKHENFPRKAIPPQVGDIIMFPSSLFHRTIPFSSNEARICVAFDVKPA